MTRGSSAKGEVSLRSGHFRLCFRELLCLVLLRLSSIAAVKMSSDSYDPAAPPYAGFFGVMGASAAIIFSCELSEQHCVVPSACALQSQRLSAHTSRATVCFVS